LQYNQVSAPIAGIVGDVPVKVGAVVTPETQLTTITRNDVLDLEIRVPVERSPQLRIGIPVEMLDAQNRKIATGEISSISPLADNTTQAILAKATFQNTENKLRDGQYAQAKVIWNRRPGVLVPTEAVSRIGPQSFVFVAQSQINNGQFQQTVRQRPVKLGDIQGQNYQVIEGLKPGESIVVLGILKLKDGAFIQPQS
jgi:RND family efflux transporter MFP subunit